MKPINLAKVGLNILARDQISYLILYVTSQCNSRCITCFYSNYLNAKKTELKFTEMEAIARHFGFLPYVLFGGGEPFLRKELAEIALTFNRQCQTRFISIPTNALLPERVEKVARNILEQADDLFLRISISIDGIGQDHDYIRGVPGNWEKVKETYKLLDRLRKEHPNFNIDASTCFNHYNQHKIRNIFDYLKANFNFNNHSLGFIRSGGPDPKVLDVDEEIYKREIKTIANEAKKADNRPLAQAFRAVTELNSEMLVRTLEEQKMQIFCTAGSKFIVIYDEGDVFPCEELPDKPMGNLRDFDYDIYKLLDTPKAKEIIKYIKDTHCFCTWECGINSNIFFSPHIYPQVAGRVAKNILRPTEGNKTEPEKEKGGI